jgi:hypothetical protein
MVRLPNAGHKPYHLIQIFWCCSTAAEPIRLAHAVNHVRGKHRARISAQEPATQNYEVIQFFKNELVKGTLNGPRQLLLQFLTVSNFCPFDCE